ncbi:acylglycerol kinase family protein [Candidatus Saccharibacteria bacterium]|nr:acylglycerol kinase family protein [Candidatus Saccharibacteria bacterium]
MQRLLIIYNPHSSRYADVRAEVLDKVTNLKGFIIGKYEVEKTDVDQNAKKLSKILKDGDLVLSVGGDATGVIATNAILDSGKDATLAVLPYGNFNDLSRTLGTSSLEDIVTWAGDGSGRGPQNALQSKDFGEGEEPAGPAQNYYPLEILIDDIHFRYATCYTTIGMTAEAVHLYDQPKMRQKLKKSIGRKFSSYTQLASWYFKNRHKNQFLPDFKLNGKLQPKNTSDYAAVNGRYMARVMKGGEYFKSPTTFRSETDRLTNFWRLFKLMMKSIFKTIPGSSTKGDTLEFLSPATVELQAEGEYKTFSNINKIVIRKSKKCLKVITKLEK